MRQLASLHFVGEKSKHETQYAECSAQKPALTMCLRIMCNLKNRNKEKGATFVPCTYYFRNHFEVPRTETGFVYHASLVDKTISTSYIDEASDSLSNTLRKCNSTKDAELLEGQPWAKGYFTSQFHSSTETNDCLLQKRNSIFSLQNKNFVM